MSDMNQAPENKMNHHVEVPFAAHSRAPMADHGTSAKPRLAFFRWPRKDLPAFIYLHLTQQLDCLSMFFDVILIQSNCDYGEVCDRYRPDLALFESGTYVGRRRITNLKSCPHVPKIGFYNGDAYCCSRTAFLSDMDRWGIETYFTLSISLAEYLPDAADNLFVWPNFVDPAIYHDYGAPKAVPILFTGSQAAHYPWRNRIHATLAEHYPLLTCPHKGWFGARDTSRMLHGERYAQMINASWVAPTCGTIANELVRKHLEIPACKSCLLTEKTPALLAAGFADMENCIFADRSDVLDKLDYVFNTDGELERIASAGYELVQTRHTLYERDQILSWFALQSSLSNGQRIVQNDPFGPLMVVDRNAGVRSGHIVANGLDRVLLRRANEMLGRRDYKEAEVLFIRCLNYHFVPEAMLGVALCSLYGGNADRALGLIESSIKKVFQGFGAADPDPIEWAFFVVCLLCQGKIKEAGRRACQFPTLHHPELERCRAIMSVLVPTYDARVHFGAGGRTCRPSVHRRPERDMQSWVHEIVLMLRASGQNELADRLSGGARRDAARKSRRKETVAESIRPLIPKLIHLKSPGWLVGRVAKWGVTRRIAPWAARSSALLGASRRVPVLRHLWKFDEFCRTVKVSASKESAQTALLIRGCEPSFCADAFAEGLRQNPCMPILFSASYVSDRHKWYAGGSASGGAMATYNTTDVIHGIKQENALECFDLVFIDGPLPSDWQESDQLTGAKLIYVNGTDNYLNSVLMRKLMLQREYTLIAHNPLHRAGYAIFQRCALRTAGSARVGLHPETICCKAETGGDNHELDH
jgi:Glycosyl transferases group 1